ncbi:peptidase inhibitor family I36 protein [Nocardia sp. CA-135953]|uniref:peptidase inhibitor family I36 protein n=1 Tax=Nocardia sp. CA-135953 TaxID=3239978 RepID=UPI003D98B127
MRIGARMGICICTARGGGGRIAYFRLGSTDLRLEGVDGAAYSIWNRTSQEWTGSTEHDDRRCAIFHIGAGWQSDIPAT